MTATREEMLDGLDVVTRPVWNADLVSHKVNFERPRKGTKVWVERWPALRVAEKTKIIRDTGVHHSGFFFMIFLSFFVNFCIHITKLYIYFFVCFYAFSLYIYTLSY